MNSKLYGSLVGIFVLLFLMVPDVQGTQQVRDSIIYEGEKYPLSSMGNFGPYPMEAYFKKHPEKLRDNVTGMCSAMWRGHMGIYKVIEKKLHLVDLLGTESVFGKQKKASWMSGGKSTLFRKVFPERTSFPVTWFTAMEILYKDRIVDKKARYDDESKFKEYIFLDFEKGILKREKVLNRTQFVEYKKLLTKDLKKDKARYDNLVAKEQQFYAELVEKYDDSFGKTDEEIEQGIMDSIIGYNSKFPTDVGMK